MSKKEPEITKIIVGIGETKNIGNFESLKIYNELEAKVSTGDRVSDIQKNLREKVLKLNERDFNSILN